MPMRSSTHITDTRAVRLIMSKLNPNWLLRSLEERDYGIDLSLEKFNGDEPTGNYVFIQVKGHEKKFRPLRNGMISFPFPVDTLKYAELFRIPFFALIVSLQDEEIYFVSLQHYIQQLDIDPKHANWRSQTTVNLLIPSPENNFISNFDKFEGMVEKDYKLQNLYNSMQCYYELLSYFHGWQGLKSANILISEIEKFLYFVEKTDEHIINEMLRGTPMAAAFNPDAIKSKIDNVKTKKRMTAKDINDLKSQICQAQQSIFKIAALQSDLTNGFFPY